MKLIEAIMLMEKYKMKIRRPFWPFWAVRWKVFKGEIEREDGTIECGALTALLCQWNIHKLPVVLSIKDIDAEDWEVENRKE